MPFKFVQLPEKKIFICNQGNTMFDFFLNIYIFVWVFSLENILYSILNL